MSLAELRALTAPHHTRIEERLDVFRRVITQTDYENYLIGFYRLHARLEPAIFSWPDWQRWNLNLNERRKLPALEQDLAGFGISAEKLEPAGLPLPAAFPGALGWFYVLEGSTLGGQFIARHFAQKLGLAPERGLAYFTAYGSQCRPKWQEFCGLLESYFADEASQKELLIESACTAFDQIGEHLEEAIQHGH